MSSWTRECSIYRLGRSKCSNRFPSAAIHAFDDTIVLPTSSQCVRNILIVDRIFQGRNSFHGGGCFPQTCTENNKKNVKFMLKFQIENSHRFNLVWMKCLKFSFSGGKI